MKQLTSFIVITTSTRLHRAFKGCPTDGATEWWVLDVVWVSGAVMMTWEWRCCLMGRTRTSSPRNTLSNSGSKRQKIIIVSLVSDNHRTFRILYTCLDVWLQSYNDLFTCIGCPCLNSKSFFVCKVSIRVETKQSLQCSNIIWYTVNIMYSISDNISPLCSFITKKQHCIPFASRITCTSLGLTLWVWSTVSSMTLSSCNANRDTVSKIFYIIDSSDWYI